MKHAILYNACKLHMQVEVFAVVIGYGIKEAQANSYLPVSEVRPRTRSTKQKERPRFTVGVSTLLSYASFENWSVSDIGFFKAKRYIILLYVSFCLSHSMCLMLSTKIYKVVYISNFKISMSFW